MGAEKSSCEAGILQKREEEMIWTDTDRQQDQVNICLADGSGKDFKFCSTSYSPEHKAQAPQGTMWLASFPHRGQWECQGFGLLGA